MVIRCKYKTIIFQRFKNFREFEYPAYTNREPNMRFVLLGASSVSFNFRPLSLFSLLTDIFLSARFLVFQLHFTLRLCITANVEMTDVKEQRIFLRASFKPKT